MDMQQFDNVGDDRRRPVRCRGYVHVIESGDTLYKLAKKYDVRLFDIMRLNPYVNVYNLQVGDEVCIPTTAERPEKTYVVNEGDTLEDVLKAFGMEFETLARWNPTLMEIELPEGLILRVPVGRQGDSGYTEEEFNEGETDSED
ncbi:MAG: LysM peptidoglycan-binding domain-containing protein [Bacteroidales bacterium]|nr:LysM peptidoglycan-binding domain-containing protein [Clostridium sp.]MCM1203148.1 LysM peptidoglycan-binding domain-containing protein [Bacteroidales bacterium]